MSELSIGFLGGVPPALGGGGLELQRQRTAAALDARGAQVIDVEAAGPDASFDVLHAFGAEPGTWQTLSHWTRNRCPLVVSPVIVIGPGRADYAQRLSSRVPV